MTTPLKLTAHIHGAVAYNRDEGLPIDGALCYHAALERLGERFFDPPDNDTLARESATPDPDCGLATYEIAGTWVYRASLAEIHGDHGTEIHHWNKRIDEPMLAHLVDRGALKPRRVQLGAGEFKSYHQPVYSEIVERLVWYVEGDERRIRELVPRIRALGKKRGTGGGRVLRWEIEPHDVPDRWLYREDGALARSMPLDSAEAWEGERILAGFRPPYWLPSNQAVCAR